MFVQPGIIYEKGPDFIPASKAPVNYLSAPSIVCLSQIWPVWVIRRRASSPHFTRNNLIEARSGQKGSAVSAVQSHAGIGVWEVSPWLNIVKVPPSKCRGSLWAQRTVRWKVEDVTSDGVKIQKPAANIKLYVSVHIFDNIPDADDRGCKSDSEEEFSAAVFMREHTSSGPSPVKRLLEHYWEHILPLASKQMSKGLLHCPSSPPVIVPWKNCAFYPQL